MKVKQRERALKEVERKIKDTEKNKKKRNSVKKKRERKRELEALWSWGSDGNSICRPS